MAMIRARSVRRRVAGAVSAKLVTSLALAALAAAVALGLAITDPQEGDDAPLRWGTSSTGSSGHRALVSLASVLDRELEDYDFEVTPTAGALATVRGYATGDLDGYYGADVAFREIAQDEGRFEGFRDEMTREPVQSFWAYTMEVGLAVRAEERGEYEGWADLGGRRVFTGPPPWDIRAQLERAMGKVGAAHEYVEIDLGLAGSALSGGSIDAFVAYTAGEASLAPWVGEAEMATDLAVLNPSDEEVETLRRAGLEVADLEPDLFRTEVHADPVRFVPFYYGFHLGLDVPAEDVRRMLEIIEESADELAEADSVFAQIAEDMPALQRRGVEASVADAKVHPGLADYMRARDVWDEAWNGRIKRSEAE